MLLIKAPPTPPNKIPTMIMLTRSGSSGMGPDKNMQTMKNKHPQNTIFPKCLFCSGMKLSANEVMLKVMVSIEKIRPTAHTGKLSLVSLSWRSGSLKVRHIREQDMHRAVEKILYFLRIWKKLMSSTTVEGREFSSSRTSSSFTREP